MPNQMLLERNDFFKIYMIKNELENIEGKGPSKGNFNENAKLPMTDYERSKVYIKLLAILNDEYPQRIRITYTKCHGGGGGGNTLHHFKIEVYYISLHRIVEV